MAFLQMTFCSGSASRLEKDWWLLVVMLVDSLRQDFSEFFISGHYAFNTFSIKYVCPVNTAMLSIELSFKQLGWRISIEQSSL